MSDIFTIRARKCKRCGRLLVSSEAIERGYGCQCAKRVRQEEIDSKPVPGQMELFYFIKQTESEG